MSVAIRRFLEHLEIEKNCSRLTIRNYLHYLERFEKFLAKELDRERITVEDVNSENVRRFRLFLARQKGINGEMKLVTQGYYVIAIRSFLKWLIKNDYKVLQPEKIDVPKEKDHSLKFLDNDMMERLLNQPILSTKEGLRDKVILELLFSTGLRVSELVSLNREQIDLKNREFGVIGKGGRARVVFLSTRVTEILERYLRERIDKMTPLFIRYNGKKDEVSDSDESRRLTARSIQRMVKKYVRNAKLPVAATPHTLRHSMATDLLRSGADIRSVQEMLGHKNIATTQIYTHVTNSQLRKVHEEFHSGNKKK